MRTDLSGTGRRSGYIGPSDVSQRGNAKMPELLFIVPIFLTFVVCGIVFRKRKNSENRRYPRTRKSKPLLKPNEYLNR
jgi:hypothetical protein